MDVRGTNRQARRRHESLTQYRLALFSVFLGLGTGNVYTHMLVMHRGPVWQAERVTCVSGMDNTCKSGT